MKLTPALNTYRQLEQKLIRVFRHFDGLCKHCFDDSVTALRDHRNVDPDDLCCCLVDNQVQDHWRTTNAAQTAAHGSRWNKVLADKETDWLNVGRRRLPGNGPCPALSCSGCILKDFRPPTCSTQLCPKMLRILNNLKIVTGPTTAPRQLEELGGVPSPLNAMFGLPGPKATPKSIAQFAHWLDEFDARCLAIPKDRWQAEIKREQDDFARVVNNN